MKRTVQLLLLGMPLALTTGYPLLSLLLSAITVRTESGIVLSGNDLLQAVSNVTYMQVLLGTLGLCLATAIISLVIALPTALFVWSRPSHWQMPLLMLLVLPMFMSYIVKVYTVRSLLGMNGFFNQVLVKIGILTEPTTFLLFNRTSVLLTFVVLYIPFASLPIYLSLERVPDNLISAARDLGAAPGTALRTVVLPLAGPGILAAVLFTFILALGDFVTPQMVGGTTGMTFGRVVWSQFGLANDYPMGASLGLVLLVVTLLAFGLAALISKVLFNRVRS